MKKDKEQKRRVEECARERAKKNANEEIARRSKQERLDERHRKHAIAVAESEQRGYYKKISAFGEHSIGVFELMPGYLTDAEKYLDQAEIDFADNALAPFWNCIEETATRLAYFNEGAQSIKDDSSNYSKLIHEYKDTPPEFPLTSQSVSKLGVGTATSERMQAIVRKAQCNFQFATIYEQRKTNQLLVTGFTNLAQALDQMTLQLKASITDLTDSVKVMTSTLNQSLSAIHSRMNDIENNNSRRHEELMVRQKKTAEKLDNIQATIFVTHH